MLSGIIFLILSLIIHQSNGQLKKCCPINEILQMETFLDSDLSSNSAYNCINNTIIAQQDEESVMESKINGFTQSNEFISFNIHANQQSHFPKCDEKEILTVQKLNEPMKINLNSSCVDLLDNSYHLLSCNGGIEKERQDIYKIKKCCPSGMSYNVFTHMCITNNVSNLNEIFRDIFDEKIVLFESDKIKCSVDDALVEYHSNVHDLKIFEGSLAIPNYDGHGPEVFSRNSFCIDSTISMDIVKPIGMTDDHFNKKSSSKWIAKVCRKQNVCDKIPCIRKCCDIGEKMIHLNSSSGCEPHHQDIEISFHDVSINLQNVNTGDVMEPKEFGILFVQKCEKFQLEPDEIHYISGKDGSLYYDEKFYHNHQYCVENFQDLEHETPEILMKSFICFDDDEQLLQTIKFHYYATLLAISAFFLAITFLVYIFLPKLLNLHGKTVVCHVLSLFIGYSFLSGIQYSTNKKHESCVIFAFIIYFGLLASFSWLNVMCLDIYWTFGSVRASQGTRRTKEMKRFMYYSLYAWGFPFLMTIFTSMMNIYDVLPDKFKPKIGDTKCWFEEQSSPPHLIFFLLPIGIQISINFILFILTAIHCNRIKAEIHRMRCCDGSDQQKKKLFVADKAIFVMNLKLFCVMGISWLLEILATLYKQNSMWWTITDTFNCFQGVMVFLIFVFKKKVLVEIRKKLGTRLRWLGKQQKASGSTTLSTMDSYSISVNRNTGRFSKVNSAVEIAGYPRSSKE